MRVHVLAAATLGAALFVAPRAMAIDKTDHAFAMKAANGGTMEVNLGRLVVEKGQNPDVKAFAQQMVDDHTKVNDELKQLAGQKGLKLPEKTKGKERQEEQRLSKLSGGALDRAYMETMVQDHQKDAKEFEHASRSLKDPDLKALANKTLPVLQEHLRRATEINQKLQRPA